MDIIPQLDVTSYSSQLFWFFLSFGILYFVINKKVLPKVENIIKKRYNITKGAIDCFENDLNLIQKELEIQLLKVNTARIEADKIITSALQEVKDINTSLIVTLNEETQKMFNMADEYLSNTKHQAEQELIGLTFEIALIYYSKMLGSTEYIDKDKLRDITTKLYKEKV